MTNVIRHLWSLFLFTFPFSIRFLVYEDATYRFGIFNPWVSGFVYLLEILLLIVVALWIINKIRNSKLEIRNLKESINTLEFGIWILAIAILFILNAVIITFLRADGVLAVMFLVRILEAVAIFLLISDNIIKPKKVITILLFSALLQIIWGLLQVALNHSLGLYFLGESIIGPDVLSVAKNKLVDGTKQIRAYGSFLHPNILAGYLLIVFFLALKYLKSGSRLFWFIVFVIGIYLTKSRAAMLVGTVGLGFYLLFHVIDSQKVRRFIVGGVMMIFLVGNIYVFINSYNIKTDDPSFKERLTQNVISKNMAKANPLGVGVRNFTLKMENYSGCGANGGAYCRANSSGSQNAPQSEAILRKAPDNTKLLPWDFQPVHNVYFLILNEAGVQGLVLLLTLIVLMFSRYWYINKTEPLLLLILLASFDHFLWDSWAGMMMIGLVCGFLAIKNKSFEEVVN